MFVTSLFFTMFGSDTFITLIAILLSNSYYSLGDGTTEHRGDEPGEMGNNLTVVDLGTAFVPIEIEAGWHHVCSIAKSKAVKCWGQLIHTLSVYLAMYIITIDLC